MNQDIRIELIKEPERLEEVRGAWEDLWAAAPAASTVQHPEMCMSADALRNNPGRRLVLLTAWRRNTLVAVFPLVTWSRLFVSFFGAASGSAGYTVPLFAPGEDVELLTQKMLDHLKTGTLGAMIRLPHLKGEAAFGASVLKRRDAVVTGSFTTFEIRGVRPGEWDDYLVSKTGKGRMSGYRRKRRQLSEMGSLKFEEVLETSEKLTTLDWLFDHKQKWLAAKGKKPGGFASALGYQIRRKQISERGHDNVFQVYRLTLNDRILSAMLMSRQNNTVYLNANAQDSEFDKHSVGRILMEDTFQAAIEQNLPVNLGFGDNDYKQSFANHKAIVYGADLFLGGASLAIPAYQAYLKLCGKGVPKAPRQAAKPTAGRQWAVGSGFAGIPSFSLEMAETWAAPTLQLAGAL